MLIEQIYTGCLAQGSYYIESDGEVVVIDPLREVQHYIDKANAAGARIKYIFETHFHADFVSGHLDLANATGATIVYGPGAKTSFHAHIAEDGQCFNVGSLFFQILHTPGHTMESSCYLLRDEKHQDVAIFTGDTLFIGDVGRPDLAQQTASGITQEDLAGWLYDSLHQKIMPLADAVIVYPAHGAGSACGKNMSSERSDTLGHQKQTNYALQPGLSKSDFISQVTAGLLPPPAYFSMNVEMNSKGYEPVDYVVKRGTKAIDPDNFQRLLAADDLILLDTRRATVFARGFIPGSVNIGLDGNFAPWVGSLIPYKKQGILIVAEDGREEEVVTRLARIGYDNTLGYLKDGFEQWAAAGKPVDTIHSISASELNELAGNSDLKIIDVRKETEYEVGRVVNGLNLPLDLVNEKGHLLNKEDTYYIHCAAGYRSMVFVSILKARGYNNLVDVDGGFNAIKNDCHDLLDFTTKKVSGF